MVSQLMFMGDSTGVDLILLTTQALLARHLPVPRALIALSPLFGSFESFTSMYVIVSTAEVLVDDVRSVAQNAREVGADATFEEGLYLMHIYPLCSPSFPEEQSTLDSINNWIQTIFTGKDNE